MENIIMNSELEKEILKYDTGSNQFKSDFTAFSYLIANGGEQPLFNEWLLNELKTNKRQGWFKPMCLFRSYSLRGKKPTKDVSDLIRAEIRAVLSVKNVFTTGPLNRAENKRRFNEWKLKNSNLIQVSFEKNSQVFVESTVFFPDNIEIQSDAEYVEGTIKTIIVNAYERDNKARQECIRIHGLNCFVCGINFEKVYGKIGKGFIHVHHLKPISEIKKEYIINPVTDLCPLCPNCHAMAHQKNPPFSINDLKELIKK